MCERQPSSAFPSGTPPPQPLLLLTLLFQHLPTRTLLPGPQWEKTTYLNSPPPYGVCPELGLAAQPAWFVCCFPVISEGPEHLCLPVLGGLGMRWEGKYMR